MIMRMTSTEFSFEKNRIIGGASVGVSFLRLPKLAPNYAP